MAKEKELAFSKLATSLPDLMEEIRRGLKHRCEFIISKVREQRADIDGGMGSTLKFNLIKRQYHKNRGLKQLIKNS